MVNNSKVLIGGKSPKYILKKYGSPLYVYDANVIQKRCKLLKQHFPNVNFYFACKANTNPEIVRLIFKQGFGIEAVSPGEISVARDVGVPFSRISFTCGSISEDELVSVAKQGVRVYLDSLGQVEIFGKNFRGKEISVRLNQGIGAGHHPHVITGGPDSKFGIDITHIGKLNNLANKYKLKIVGLHQHIGSNILDVPTFLMAFKALCNTALSFSDLRHLNFGGGFGVPYAPSEKKLNLELLGEKVVRQISIFTKKYGRPVEVSFEPGRYLVAEAGMLLVTVNDIKRNPTKVFVGVDSGFNHLLRPAMYDSYHDIVNTTHPNNKKEKVTIVGNICESGDIFAKDRLISTPENGDVLAIQDTGAYGYVMSSDYNLRKRPKEILVKGNNIKIISS